MKREILFRGKRLDNGEWVEGYLYVTHNGEHEIGCYNAELNIERLTHVVDPATVGQYTGLKDKNGRKIFEGDIIETDLKRPYLVVVFRDGCFMVNCNDGGEDYFDILLPILKEPQTAYKYGAVIGNIHDNPDLMEDKRWNV